MSWLLKEERVAENILRREMSWLLKEERVAECLMSWGKLLQMWGPKSEKVRKPWGLLFFCG